MKKTTPPRQEPGQGIGQHDSLNCTLSWSFLQPYSPVVPCISPLFSALTKRYLIWLACRDWRFPIALQEFLRGGLSHV